MDGEEFGLFWECFDPLHLKLTKKSTKVQCRGSKHPPKHPKLLPIHPNTPTILQYFYSKCVQTKILTYKLSVKSFCRKVSMTVTSLSICGSFMYLPFLVKTCSSGMQLTMNSNGNTLCTSQMCTF